MASQFAFWCVTHKDGTVRHLKFMPIISIYELRMLYPEAKVRKMTTEEMDAYKAKHAAQYEITRNAAYCMDV